jgi:hypothetical protein
VNPFLLLEGGDGTGKSSLGAALAVRWTGVLLHYGKPDSEPLEMYVARPARWLGSQPIVMDRSFIGSRVWSRLGFHPPVLRTRQWRDVCTWYAENGAHCWIMVKAPEAIRNVVALRGESEQQQFEAIQGQAEFIEMLINNEILYIPSAAYSAGLTTAMMEG